MIKKIKHKLAQDTNLNEIISGSVLTFLLKIGGMLLGYIAAFLIAKKLGASGMGFYNLMTQLLLVIGTICALGLNLSVIRFAGQFNNKQSSVNLKSVYAIYTKMVLPVTCIIGATMALFASSISSYLHKSEQFEVAIFWLGCSLPFYTLTLISTEYLRGLKLLKISETIRTIIRPLIIVLGFTIFFNYSLNKIHLIYFLVLGIGINSLISRIVTYRYLRNIAPGTATIDQKDIIRTSLPMMVTSICSVLLTAMPVFFLDYFGNEATVGVFSIAFRLAGLVSLTLMIINTIAGPKFSELFWANKHRELQKLLTQSTQIMFWLSLFATMVLIIGARWWMTLFGQEFTSGSSVLILLLIGQFFNAATGSVGLFMNMSGNQGMVRTTILICTVLALIAYLIFVPQFGLIAAGLISMSSSILLNGILVVYVQKRLNFRTYYLPFLTTHENK